MKPIKMVSRSCIATSFIGSERLKRLLKERKREHTPINVINVRTFKDNPITEIAIFLPDDTLSFIYLNGYAILHLPILRN